MVVEVTLSSNEKHEVETRVKTDTLRNDKIAKVSFVIALEENPLCEAEKMARDREEEEREVGGSDD